MPIYNHHWLDSQGRFATAESASKLTVQGPILSVVVSVTAQHAQALQSLDGVIPEAAPGYALLDTGAALCAVDQEIMRGLGVPPTGYSLIQGATEAKPMPTPTFPASLSFPNTTLPNITFENFAGLPLKSQGIIAIIGRSVLQHFVMVYNGPGAMVTLSY